MSNPIVSSRDADTFDSLVNQCPVCLIPSAEHPDCINCGHVFNSDDGLDDERVLDGSNFDDAIYHGGSNHKDENKETPVYSVAGVVPVSSLSGMPWDSTAIKPKSENKQCIFENCDTAEIYDNRQIDAYSLPTGCCPNASYPDCTVCGKSFAEVG